MKGVPVWQLGVWDSFWHSVIIFMLGLRWILRLLEGELRAPRRTLFWFHGQMTRGGDKNRH